MANFIAVNQMLAKNALKAMHNRLVFLKTINRQLDSQWNSSFNGFAQGTSYRINRPARFKSVAGNSIGSFDAGTGKWNSGSFVEDPIYLTIAPGDDQKNISMQFDSSQLTLELTNEKSRIGEPVGLQLATDIEKKILTESALRAGGYVIAAGNTSLGTKVATSDLLQAQAHLDALTAPQGARSTLIPAFSMAQLSRENLNLFTPTVNDGIYPTGYVKEFAGSDIYSYNLLPVYSVPALTGVNAGTLVEYVLAANVTDGASTVSITVPAADNTKVLKAGTIIEFAVAEVVNPETRESIGKKYSFALAKDVTLATGTTVLELDPAAKIYGPADDGNRQNITALPSSGSSVYVVGGVKSTAKSYDQIVMYSEDAFTGTIIPLTVDLPGAFAQRADYDGFSVRTAVQMVVGSDTVVHRFDVYGKGILQRDQYAVRILVPKA